MKKDVQIQRIHFAYVRIHFMILLPYDSWEIKTTPKKGRGIFATRPIAPGTIIGDYIGRVIKTAKEDTSQKDGLYLMYYHDFASIYPTDIHAPGIHLINHSCAPNCWIFTYQGHTLTFTLRNIFAGEELTISYLLSPNVSCNPCMHSCACESNSCTRTMHLSQKQFEEWNTFYEEQVKKTKRKRIRYGHELPKLSSYPDSIPDHPIYKLSGSTEQPPLRLTHTTVPSLEEIRSTIRTTGKTLHFPHLKTKIISVQNGTTISEKI